MFWDRQGERSEDFCFGRRIDFVIRDFVIKSISDRKKNCVTIVLNQKITSRVSKLIVVCMICLASILPQFCFKLTWFGIAKGRGVRISVLAVRSTL